MSYADHARVEAYEPFRLRVKEAVESVIVGIASGATALPANTVTLNQCGALERDIANNQDKYLDQYAAVVVASIAAVIDAPPTNQPEDAYNLAITDAMITSAVFPMHLELAAGFPA
jgi:hypothetical protein